MTSNHSWQKLVRKVNWTVYILQCADGTLYTGITNDLERRMAEHEAGHGARYTKGRGPFLLVYQETCQGRGPASKREIEIKSMDRKAKLSLVSGKAFGNVHNAYLGMLGTP